MIAAHGRGDLRGSLTDPQTPFEVLDEVVATMKMPADSIQGWHGNLKTLTLSGGLRTSVAFLGEDPRTVDFLPKVGDLLEHGPRGEVTMKNMAQVEGYVFGAKPGEYRDWREPILKEVREAANRPSVEAMPIWDNPALRGTAHAGSEARAMHDYTQRAQEDGVDLGMLSRAAGYMHEHQAEQAGPEQHLGAMAIGVPEQNYDQLFQ